VRPAQFRVVHRMQFKIRAGVRDFFMAGGKQAINGRGDAHDDERHADAHQFGHGHAGELKMRFPRGDKIRQMARHAGENAQRSEPERERVVKGKSGFACHLRGQD